MFKYKVVFISLIFVSVAIFGTYAQFDKPAKAIEYREAAMFLIGQHFSRMGAMVKGNVSFNKERFEKNAGFVNTMVAIPWEAFMEPGTEKGKATRKTTMNGNVFKEKDKFNQLAKAFTANTAGLYDVARWGDMKMIKTQFAKTAQDCKGCHNRYRTK